MKPFSKTIGIIGGGQLGKMLIESSRKWNVNYTILDAENAPSKHLAKKHIVGGLKDGDKIQELANSSEVLTYEIEHINFERLLDIEHAGKEVIPSAKVLQIINDKGVQKDFYVENGIHTSPYKLVETAEEWIEAASSFKGDKVVLKSRTGGYDGKGVKVLRKEELTNSDVKDSFNGPCLLEECVDFEKEIAVIVAVGVDGEIKCFPTVEMEFHPVANLVEFLFSPAEITETLEVKVQDLAIKTAKALNSPGIFAIEMFLTKDGEVFVNETAPRPHNSGHHTIEGCVTSQYEQLNRILLGLPLGDTTLRRPTAMINLIGAEGVNGAYRIDKMDTLMHMDGVHIHLYNKDKTSPYRKLGHVTIESDSVAQLKEQAKRVNNMLKVVPA